MWGPCRAGILLLLAACGGGDRASRADTTAMATPPPGDQATVPAADTARHDSAIARIPPAAAPVAGESAASRRSRHADTAKRAAPKPAARPSPAKPQDRASAAAAAPAAAPGADGGAQSPGQVALGDSIFHGQLAGGTCTACHGQDAKGTVVAPDLTDAQWINGDGSYQFIVSTVTTGVPQPKQHPAPMPPKGGATLSDAQVHAVAAYVYSLSHR